MRLLIDLDSTLVNREQAFERWASAFIAEVNGTTQDQAWLLEADGHGYTPRAQLAGAMLERLEIAASPQDVVSRLVVEHVGHIECYPGVIDRLRNLRARGAELVIVTNGTTDQQCAKIARTGLDLLVDRIVISESLGAKKPDPRIFAAAVRGLGPDDNSWMIGDHPHTDIAGGRAAGLSTGWVSHHQQWPHAWEPTVAGARSIDVLDSLLNRL